MYQWCNLHVKVAHLTQVWGIIFIKDSQLLLLPPSQCKQDMHFQHLYYYYSVSRELVHSSHLCVSLNSIYLIWPGGLLGDSTPTKYVCLRPPDDQGECRFWRSMRVKKCRADHWKERLPMTSHIVSYYHHHFAPMACTHAPPSPAQQDKPIKRIQHANRVKSKTLEEPVFSTVMSVHILLSHYTLVDNAYYKHEYGCV